MSGSTALVALGAEDIGRARHEAARQRWRLLADALKRGAPRDTTDSCMGVSFGLVRCSPTSEDGWFLYSAQGFEVLVCHVSSAVSPKVRKVQPQTFSVLALLARRKTLWEILIPRLLNLDGNFCWFLTDCQIAN